MLKIITKACNVAYPAISANKAGFCTTKSRNPLSFMIEDYFSPFEKEDTLKGLRLLQDHFKNQNMLNPNNHIVLDVLSETPYSETHRIFDRHHKKFFAQKTIALDSVNSWNQVNLMLKQTVRRNPELGQIISLDFNERNKEIKFFSLLHKRTLGDYSYYRIKNQLPWKNEELRMITWYLFDQANILTRFDAISNQIGYSKMFIDDKTNIFKLYDLSDFTDVSNTNKIETEINADSVMHALVQVINPYAPVHNAEEAKTYLKNYHSDFWPEFKKIKNKVLEDLDTYEITKFKKNLPYINQSFLVDGTYDRLLSTKFIEILQSKNLPNFNEDAAYLYQGLGLYNEALQMFESPDYKTLPSQKHLNIAETYRNMLSFNKAQEYLDRALEDAKVFSPTDSFMNAKIQNEYGKLLSCKGQFQQAMKKFQEAEQTLKLLNDNTSTATLRNEIKKNLDLTLNKVQLFSQDLVLNPVMVNPELENKRKSLLDRSEKFLRNVIRYPGRNVGNLILFAICLYLIVKFFSSSTGTSNFNFELTLNDKDSENNVMKVTISSGSNEEAQVEVSKTSTLKNEPIKTTEPINDNKTSESVPDLPVEKTESKASKLPTLLFFGIALVGALGVSL